MLFVLAHQILSFNLKQRLASGHINGFKVGSSEVIRFTLIKLVLQSYSVYTLTSTLIPEAIIRRMESLMAQFLWTVKCEARTHWVSWSSICYPTSEGGLGFRRIEQIKDRLHANLLWLILIGGSMWAKFMRAKYLNCEQVLVKETASPLWRDLVQHYDTVRDLSRWIVGSGQ